MISPITFENPINELNKELKAFKYLNSVVEVITPSVSFEGYIPDTQTLMKHLEAAIRTAYKSEDRIAPGSDEKIVKNILSLKHESTLEHVSLSFRLITSRGITHELVRHRIASYTQESTRYVNYNKKKPQVILPWHLLDKDDSNKTFWLSGQIVSLEYYKKAIEINKWKAQDARGFLTNDLKTEIVVTMNLRSLRNFFNLRVSEAAHPDMQVIAKEMFTLCYNLLPVIFQDIKDRKTT